MTAIPPLISTIRPGARVRAATTDATDPATSFSDLLDAPAAAAAQQPRIYSFAELGMFGRHGAQSLPGTPQTAEPETPMAAAQAPAVVATMSAPVLPAQAVAKITTANATPSKTGTAQATAVNSAVSQAQPATAPSAVRASLPRHGDARADMKPDPASWKIAATATPADRPPQTTPIERPSQGGFAIAAPALEESLSETSDTTLPEELSAPDVEPHLAQSATAASLPEMVEEARASLPEAPAPARFAPPARSTSANTVNLVVSGSDDDLVIVARSMGETAEESAKIRRAVEDTAAEFGLDISEFQFNGAAVESSSSPAPGGKNGSRAR